MDMKCRVFHYGEEEQAFIVKKTMGQFGQFGGRGQVLCATVEKTITITIKNNNINHKVIVIYIFHRRRIF